LATGGTVTASVCTNRTSATSTENALSLSISQKYAKRFLLLHPITCLRKQSRICGAAIKGLKYSSLLSRSTLILGYARIFSIKANHFSDSLTKKSLPSSAKSLSSDRALRTGVFTQDFILDELNHLKQKRESDNKHLHDLQNAKDQLTELEKAEIQLANLQDVVKQIEPYTYEEKRLTRIRR
jgi:hypothetical protein